MAKTVAQLEAELAESNARLASALAGAKPFVVKSKVGESTKRKDANGKAKPYSGFTVDGNFPPAYLSDGVAYAIADNTEAFAKVVNAKRKAPAA